jgi:hypothetical protein
MDQPSDSYGSAGTNGHQFLGKTRRPQIARITSAFARGYGGTGGYFGRRRCWPTLTSRFSQRAVKTRADFSHSFISVKRVNIRNYSCEFVFIRGLRPELLSLSA